MLEKVQKQAPQIIQVLENRHQDTRHKGPHLAKEKAEPGVYHCVWGTYCMTAGELCNPASEGTTKSSSWKLKLDKL